MAGSRAQITYGGVTYQLDFARQAVWDEASNPATSQLQRQFGAPLSPTSLFSPSAPKPTGTLTILFTSAERAAWQGTYMEEFASGTTVLVWQDSAKVLEFKEYSLVGDTINVEYQRLSHSADWFFTLSLPVEVV